MQDETSRLMPIGRFSEVTSLSIKALRNYDECGLLTPAHVDPSTGYRYYSLGQTNRAEAIRLLRSVDVPLDEIREILSAGSRDAVSELLHAHKTRLERRLADVRRTLGFLQELIESREAIMPYEVSTKRAPALTVLAITTPIDMNDVGPTFGAALGEICAFAGEQGLPFVGPPFTLYSEFDEEKHSATLRICVPVTREPGVPLPGRVEFASVPEETLAWTIHRGPYREVRPAYAAVYGWMQTHGHVPSGPPRETYLNDPCEVAEADLLTEVAWPIETQKGDDEQ